MSSRLAFCLLPALVWAAFVFTSAANAVERPPNVILMFSDDQGTLDLNILGARDLYTRNLDRLARRGVLFTQFYAAAPICSPSRAALLTGRYPQRAGVPTNVAPGGDGLPPSEVTIAEMLKGAGYRTALIGKWHLGKVIEKGPLDQGFDYFFGHKRGCIDNFSHFFYWRGPNQHDLWINDREHWEDGAYFPDLMVREAERFLQENQDQPFFLYLPFNIPHYPLQPDDKWRQIYSYYPSPRRHYAALVSTLDERVGRILAKVDQLGLRENTLIIFMSDHGHSTEERTMFGGGYAGRFRGAKAGLFEAGIRVPAIVSLPGVIPEGVVREQYASAIDWMPTIAELTGTDAQDPGWDGKSLMPVIRSAMEVPPHDTLHWQLGDQWAVRRGDWKLIVNGRDTGRTALEGDDRTFLVSIKRDLTERENLARALPNITDELTELHEQWVQDVTDAAGERP